KLAHSGGHVVRPDLEQPLDRELFDGKGAHRRAVDHGAPQTALREVTAPREIPHEAAGEGIAGTRRVEDVLEWVCGSEEDFTFAKHERAMFAFLHDHELGSAVH